MRLRVFLYIIIITFFASILVAQENDGIVSEMDGKYEKEAFVEELIKQHQQILDELTYNYVRTNATQYPNKTEKSEYKAEVKKLDEKYISSTKVETIYNNDSSTYFESVVSSNPSYSFSLSRKTMDGKWKINNIQPLKSGNRREIIAILGNSIYSFLHINTIPLAALLKADNVDIESFEEKEIDDEIVVNMTLERSYNLFATCST